MVPPALPLVRALTGGPGSLTAAPKSGASLRERLSFGMAEDTGVDFTAWLPASHRPAGL
ncbi:MAG: hypothetical protein ABSA01_06755 [Anaerolineales bacterium]